MRLKQSWAMKKISMLFTVALLCLNGVTVMDAGALEPGIQANTSVYTDISGSRCRTISVDRESGASVQSCPGVAGYKLQVEDDDARMSITVVAPGGKKSELSYWQVITTAFSSLGNKAEWRVTRVSGKTTPVALIVRVNASEDPSNPQKLTSYLAVAKITAAKTCVTDKIGPSATANEEARRAADTAATRPCLGDTAQE
jgi:hypothetical protein